MPAETVFAVLPSVVSIFEPEILNELPILVDVALAASTVNWTLVACFDTIPPASAGDAIKIILKAISAFFIFYLRSDLKLFSIRLFV